MNHKEVRDMILAAQSKAQKILQEYRMYYEGRDPNQVDQAQVIQQIQAAQQQELNGGEEELLYGQSGR